MLWSISVIDDILHDSLSVCLLLLILSLFSLFLVLTFHHILATKSSRSGNLRETSPRHHLILSMVHHFFPSTQWAPSPTPFIICYLKGRCLWCCEKSQVQSWFSQGSFPPTKHGNSHQPKTHPVTSWPQQPKNVSHGTPDEIQISNQHLLILPLQFLAKDGGPPTGQPRGDGAGDI